METYIEMHEIIFALLINIYKINGILVYDHI